MSRRIKLQFQERIGNGIFAESESALTALGALDWRWTQDPGEFHFVRIKVGNVTGYYKPEEIVAKGYHGRIVMACAVVRGKDKEMGWESYHPVTAPTNKPCEAIDTRVLTGEITPAESVALTLAGGAA